MLENKFQHLEYRQVGLVKSSSVGERWGPQDYLTPFAHPREEATGF